LIEGDRTEGSILLLSEIGFIHKDKIGRTQNLCKCFLKVYFLGGIYFFTGWHDK
jgi:hypothetical protein